MQLWHWEWVCVKEALFLTLHIAVHLGGHMKPPLWFWGRIILILYIEGLKDVGWGLAEGHDGEWLDSNYPVDDINLFFSENSPIEAETAAGFVSRFGNALDEIVVKHKGQMQIF